MARNFILSIASLALGLSISACAVSGEEPDPIDTDEAAVQGDTEQSDDMSVRGRYRGYDGDFDWPWDNGWCWPWEDDECCTQIVRQEKHDHGRSCSWCGKSEPQDKHDDDCDTCGR